MLILIIFICCNLTFTFKCYSQLLEGEDFNEIENLAEKGSSYHQAVLGEMYRRGCLVKKDYSKAFSLFQSSANQNDPLGWFNLAVMFQNGYGTFKDTTKANFYYEKCLIPIRKLAEANDIRSMFTYGVLLDPTLHILMPDEEASQFWYRKAANLGHPIALNNIGGNFWSGTGVDSNLDSAIFYLEKASRLGYNSAYEHLGNLYLQEFDDTIAAVKYYEKAVELGDSGAMERMAEYCVSKKDYDKALGWYTMAAKAGELSCIRELAKIFENGHLVKRDYNQSFSWYVKAANNYDIYSIYKLGWYYFDGIGVEKDIEKARKYFTLASERGYFQAKSALEVLNFFH